MSAQGMTDKGFVEKVPFDLDLEEWLEYTGSEKPVWLLLCEQVWWDAEVTWWTELLYVLKSRHLLVHLQMAFGIR